MLPPAEHTCQLAERRAELQELLAKTGDRAVLEAIKETYFLQQKLREQYGVSCEGAGSAGRR